MALPSVIRDMNTFIKETSFIGVVNEATLPKIVTKTADMVLSGFAGDIERDLGKLEKLESNITVSQYSSIALGLVGDRASRDETLVIRGAIDIGDSISKLAVKMQGLWKEVDFGSFKPEETVGLKFAIAVEVYTLEIDDQEIIHIDKENNIFRVNGKDRNEKIREALAQ